MLGSVTTTTPSLHTHTATATVTATATASATPSSPLRSSRLRGLSYLRNYTHHHLHRSDQAPPLVRSTSSPVASVFTASRSATPTHPAPSTTFAEQRGSQAELLVLPPLQQQATPTPTPTSTSTSTILSGEHGWIPAIQGRSGLTSTTSTNTVPATPEPNTTISTTSTIDTMTRSRAAAAFGPTASARRTSSTDLPEIAAMPSAMQETTTTTTTTSTMSGPSKDSLPTIRFIPHVENRSSRPSLQFNALSRQLKTPDAKVKVGRYSERDSNTSDVVGFKSKVVSRRHCEFWCTDGQWYVKDVKSSSGTFLNHVRLSSPGVESRPYPVNDGDVVQLGIDFKGGEEVIFRCVKIRIECNRGWQKSLNSFNTSAHKRILMNSAKSTPKGKVRDSDAASVNSSECSICLNAVAPCQALFVAPCSHVWHYKCIRGLIHGPNYPNFLCPNCRMVADLEADVEQPEEEVFEEFDEAELQVNAGGEAFEADQGARIREQRDGDEHEAFESAPSMGDRVQNGGVDEDLAKMLHDASLGSPLPQVMTRSDRSSSSALPLLNSQPIDISRSRSTQRTPSDSHGARSTTPTSHTQFALSVGPHAITEGPMTPRNDAGPFVLDGSAGRDRIDNNLMAQAVAEISEPVTPVEKSGRKWPL